MRSALNSNFSSISCSNDYLENEWADQNAIYGIRLIQMMELCLVMSENRIELDNQIWHRGDRSLRSSMISVL
jgi:hypothetical protein